MRAHWEGCLGFPIWGGVQGCKAERLEGSFRFQGGGERPRAWKGKGFPSEMKLWAHNMRRLVARDSWPEIETIGFLMKLMLKVPVYLSLLNFCIGRSCVCFKKDHGNAQFKHRTQSATQSCHRETNCNSSQQKQTTVQVKPLSRRTNKYIKP